jgi:adenosine deaminase
MRVEFIQTCSRHFGFASNQSSLDLLQRPVGAEFLGLDLAGDESCDALQFVAAFNEWKDAGKFLTIHAGEDPAGSGPKKVAEALDLFRADRIGHGTRSVENPALVQRLARDGVTLELCPTSNLQTCSVAGAAQHPLKTLLSAGVRATINTDDPTICGTTLSAEYAFAQQTLGLEFDDLKRCTLNAVNAAFISAADKKLLADQIELAWA